MTTEDQYRVEYNDLLGTISGKLNANELRRLTSMCRGMISTANNFDDAMALFQELEIGKKLGIDRLDILKTSLKLLKKNALLKKVEEFEMRRKAYRSGILPSLRSAAAEVLGVIKIVCNFGTIGKGLLALGAGLALHCCNNREEYIDTFNRVVLPAATKLIGTNVNSLCFIVQAETVQALETLWKQYQDGTLQKRLQQFLRTDNENILQLIGGNVQFDVSIDEQEYKNALLDLMILQTTVAGSEGGDQPVERSRRNSDSALYVRPKEREVALVLPKLKQTEIEFQREIIASLENEMKKEHELMTESGVKTTSPAETGFQKSHLASFSKVPKRDESMNWDTDSCYSSECEFRSKGLKKAEIGKEFQLIFETTDVQGQKYYKEDDHIMVRIQAPTGNFLKKKIEDRMDGTYTVSFTPDMVGPHRVLITVNSQPLTGSPWSVQVYHQYKHVFSFGSHGSGPGQLKFPEGISINGNTGHIAVADSGNNRVQTFSADGSYIRDFGQTEVRIAQRLHRPRSVAFNKNGDLIVVDNVLKGGKQIFLFSESGQFIRKITNKQLKKARRLSVAPDGNIIVYDKDDKKIKVFSPDCAQLLQSFSADIPNDMIYHQEMFFVSFLLNDVVKVYNKEGVFLYDIGGEGSGDGQLNCPHGLAIDKFNNVIVCDTINDRVQVFTVDGQFVNTIGGIDSELDGPRDVAVSETGRVYVTEDEHVHVFQ